MTLLAKFNTLNRRERYAIMATIGVIGIFLIAQFIVEPIFSRTEQKRKNLRAKAVMLEQMQKYQAEYEELTRMANISKSRYRKRQKGFTLFSFMDQLAGEAGIKDRISYMRPTTTVQKNSSYKLSRVEMKLDDVTLEQLTSYLYGIETSKNMVIVKKLSITKKEKDEGLVNVILQVETLEA